MAAQGVNCAIHYPVPIHLQRAYGFLGIGLGSFPVAERCARELLSLPMYPELRAEEVALVAETLKKCRVSHYLLREFCPHNSLRFPEGLAIVQLFVLVTF